MHSNTPVSSPLGGMAGLCHLYRWTWISGEIERLEARINGLVALIQQLRAGREDAPTAEMLADAEVKLVTARAVLESAKGDLGAKPL